jgi:hypothetical protein
MTTAISDAFTGTNGTALTSHPPDVGGSWSKFVMVTGNGGSSNGGEIQSNKAQISPGISGNNAHNDVGVVMSAGNADVTLTVDFTTPSSLTISRPCVIFRASSSSSGNHLVWRLRGADGDSRIAKTIGGTQTAIDTVAFSWATNTTYALKLILSGNSVKVYIDNVLKHDLTISDQNTAQYFGIGRGNSDGNDSFDNFLVTVAGSIVPILNTYKQRL